MKERAIHFTVTMAAALIAGRKTQTRRLIKPQPVLAPDVDERLVNAAWQTGHIEVPCPYGKIGERLWVREPYLFPACWDALPPREVPREAHIHYLADGEPPTWFDRGRYRHGRFMPRWASRAQLEIVDVRVERAQWISGTDAEAEGILAHVAPYSLEKVFRDQRGARAIEYFQLIWERINGAESWAANPWVWVVEFKRVTNG